MHLLGRLAAREQEAWKEVFHILYPVAYESARARLGDRLQSDAEDVAIETLTAIVDHVGKLSTEDELKGLAAAIAHNLAVDHIRKRYSAKRGGHSLESLDSRQAFSDEPGERDFLDQLAVKELTALLTELSGTLKKEYRLVLHDHFFEKLTHAQIAEKRNIPMGTVGVYIQRGLAGLRGALAQRPQLKAELSQMLGDGPLVRVVLPLVSALQLGGILVDGFIRYQIESGIPSILMDAPAAPPSPQSGLDHQSLRDVPEDLPAPRSLSPQLQARLLRTLSRITE